MSGAVEVYVLTGGAVAVAGVVFWIVVAAAAAVGWFIGRRWGRPIRERG